MNNELITMTRCELDEMQERTFAAGLKTGIEIGNQNGRDCAERAAHVENMRRYDIILATPAPEMEMENEAEFISSLSKLAMSY